MTPRTASLRVAHQSSCALRQRITDYRDDGTPKYADPNKAYGSTAELKKAGCTCTPSYYTFHRGLDGKPRKSERVADRRTAETMLKKLQVEIAEGRAGVKKAKNMLFPEWCAEFLRQWQLKVDNGTVKRRTVEGYRETIDHFAIPAIGWINCREIGVPDLRRFHEATMKKVGIASQARHLSHLNVVLSTAVDEELMDGNPLTAFKKRLNLPKPKRGKAPFEDGELQRLWAAYRQHMAKQAKPWAPVYLYAAQFSTETGLRIGELAALDLDSIRGASVRVKHTWNPVDGLIAPKDGEERVVYLTQWALDILAEWLPIRGGSDGPLFAAPHGGRMSIREAQRKLAQAMETTGIPKLHPDVELPRSYHSLRYTTSNVLQRRGFDVRFIQQALGHSSIGLTLDVYGQWTPAQLAAEAARLTPER